MPYIDVDAAERELEAEAEPWVLGIGGREYSFPGSMPAAVEKAQLQIDRAKRQGKPTDGLDERLMRAALGEHYDEIVESCTEQRQTRVLMTLMRGWMDGLADPNRARESMERIQARAVPLGQRPTLSNGSSSKSSGHSKPTSNGSTGSTSPAPSTDLVEVAPGRWSSPGGASSPSSGASRRKP
jgi:hypothetical protein